jgi:hypothetical protein
MQISIADVFTRDISWVAFKGKREVFCTSRPWNQALDIKARVFLLFYKILEVIHQLFSTTSL